MTQRVAIVGVGGSGRECYFVARAMMQSGADLEVVGFFDDATSTDDLARLAALGQGCLGRFEDLLTLDPTQGELFVILGIGDPAVRGALDVRLRDARIRGAVLIHPDSTVGDDVVLDEGCVVFPGARLMTNIRVGRHVHVHPNATVGHDTVVEDYVSLNPAASVSGGCVIQQGAYLGAGSLVLQGLRVGRGSVVGGAACVVRDVPPDQVVKGVPAR